VWTSLRCMLCLAYGKPTVADLSEKPHCAKHMLCAWLIAKNDTPLGVLPWPHAAGLQFWFVCVCVRVCVCVCVGVRCFSYRS
jgi:hypothetical protein